MGEAKDLFIDEVEDLSILLYLLETWKVVWEDLIYRNLIFTKVSISFCNGHENDNSFKKQLFK